MELWLQLQYINSNVEEASGTCGNAEITAAHCFNKEEQMNCRRECTESAPGVEAQRLLTIAESFISPEASAGMQNSEIAQSRESAQNTEDQVAADGRELRRRAATMILQRRRLSLG